MKYAGFWRRFAAYWIDALPIFVLNALVFYFFFGFHETVRTYFQSNRSPEARKAFLTERNRVRDASFTLWLLYCVVMDASRFQGTFGKRLMGIRVVDSDGNRITFGRSLARNTAKILSAIPLFLGFIWIGFSKTKQAWHDKMACVYVVMNGEIADEATEAVS